MTGLLDTAEATSIQLVSTVRLWRSSLLQGEGFFLPLVVVPVWLPMQATARRDAERSAERP